MDPWGSPQRIRGTHLDHECTNKPLPFVDGLAVSVVSAASIGGETIGDAIG
jgi:hypothetical protein